VCERHDLPDFVSFLFVKALIFILHMKQIACYIIREEIIFERLRKEFTAGWSSPVARWAHNPKVSGSNPDPATI
jgi:hypothetical protein